MKTQIAAVAMMALSACQQQPSTNEDVSANETPSLNAAAPSDTTVASPSSSTNEVTSTPRPASGKVLTEPKGPIDPKSTEAAGQVVQHYGALIEQNRFAEAAGSWGDKDLAAAFAADLRSRGLKHLEIGDLSAPEGAAGSIFVTMPVVFYQGTKRSPATITLRRVNDVDGSTDAQRRWHIERIEWGTN